MKARAGVVTAEVAWLTSLPVTAAAPALSTSIKGAVAGFLIAAVASFLPDLDHPGSTAGRYMPRWFRRAMGGHRMGMHSLVSVAVVWWLTGFLLENPIAANAVAVGWSSHIVLDMLTVLGVGLLYPLSRTKFRIGWRSKRRFLRRFGFGLIVTGSRGEDRFVLGMKALGVLVCAGYGVLFVTYL